MSYKFAQLIQTPGKSSKTSTEVYIAQPDSHKEELAGKLFVIIEINENSNNSLKIINFLIDSIVHNFYQNEKLLLRERMPSLKVEHIFETSLAKTNTQFTDFIKNENIKISIENINISTGIVFKNELHISNSGNNNAYLIFPKTDKNDKSSEKFGIVNIFKNKEEQNGNSKYRLFSNVINGIIPPRASVFISNEALSEYISQKQFIEIISSLPPTSAVEQMKNIINNINTYVSFAGIIIKNTILDKNIETPRQKNEASNSSIFSLNKTEDNTEALLTPSGMISIKKWLKILPDLSDLFHKPNNPPSGGLFLKDKIFMKRKSLFNKSKQFTNNFFANLLQALLNLSRNFNFKNFLNSSIKKIPRLEAALVSLKNKFRSIIFNKKILLTVSLLFLVAFIYNISNTKKDQQTEVSIQKYNDITKEIEQKQNQADSSLLYSNDERAKKLFDEISTLIEGLPKDTNEQKTSYESFKQKFNEQLEKVRRVTRTETAELISDLKNINSNANADSLLFSKKTNKLYAADASQKSIYIISLADKSASTITYLDNPIQELKNPILLSSEDTEYIDYFNKSSILSLNTISEEFSTNEISVADPDFISGAGLYGANIYLTDNKNNEIYRYSKNGQKFDTPTAWLKDKLDLSQAVDLAIDGNIYILNSDGTVVKLLRGTNVDYKLEACDPPLEQANKISVSTAKGQDFLYVLETKNKRLVVYNKAGQFLMQYQGDNLTALKDFVVDEDNKIIYFLSGANVLRFSAVHFELK